MAGSAILHFLRKLRPQDAVWVLLFAVLGFSTARHDAPELTPLALLAVVQVLEGKFPELDSTRGRIVWIVMKLALAYVFIGYTGGITSRYWWILLLPVVSAATTFGLIGTLMFVMLATGAYLSFLLFISQGPVLAGDIQDYWVRAIMFGIAGTLVNTLAEELRLRSKQHQQTAEQLADANKQLRDAEEAMRRSDRLAALGQLSAGLAHELRNPLGTIRASSEMLSRSVASESEVAREMAGFITSEADRLNSLVTRFLQFARPLELRLDKADLAQVLDRAISAAERDVPGMSIYRNYAPEVPPFPLDAELMERVFYNLVVNAAQASKPGGAVAIKTRASARMAEVSVIDRGSGIDPKHLDAIFNPFFTTKPDGVGLGLAVVAKIVDEHGGKIAVESEPGKGSVFRVLLPMKPSITDEHRSQT